MVLWFNVSLRYKVLRNPQQASFRQICQQVVVLHLSSSSIDKRLCKAATAPLAYKIIKLTFFAIVMCIKIRIIFCFTLITQ